MSWYATELHKFVIGETRTDGFKSDWRIEQERRRAEEMGQRQFVKPKQVKAKPHVWRANSDPDRRREVVRRSLHKRRLRLKAGGICVDCGKDRVKKGCTSCGPCLKARYDRQKRKRSELKNAA